MENQNKKLKYLILSDDVKMVEKLVTKSGEPIERRAFGERLEGFGYDESFHLSGAPRVEQGKDILKGYKITLREKLEFIEVEDAISDIETKKKEKKDKK
jgi:lipopolysaccharide export system protein LptA